MVGNLATKEANKTCHISNKSTTFIIGIDLQVNRKPHILLRNFFYFITCRKKFRFCTPSTEGRGKRNRMKKLRVVVIPVYKDRGTK